MEAKLVNFETNKKIREEDHYEINNPIKGSLEDCLLQNYKYSEPLSGREKRRLIRKTKRNK